MSSESFFSYVNEELPKRLSSNEKATEVIEGLVPVTTGVGLTVEFLDLTTNPDFTGRSAYDAAVELGFDGTEEDWVASLKGEDGEPGMTAYEHAVKLGYTDTEANWLKSLKGEEGKQGDTGLPGFPIQIKDTLTEDEFLELVYPIDSWEFGDGWFVRTLTETSLRVWVKTEVGEEEQGVGKFIDSGDMRGPEGTGLVVRGEWNLPELPTEGNLTGDTYGYKHALWTWMLGAGLPDSPENYRFIQIVPEGPVGPQGLQGDKGDQGIQGETGDTGPQGKHAIPFIVVDVLDDAGALPAVDLAKPEEGYAVMIGGVPTIHAFMPETNTWRNLGTYQGPKGEKGDKGETGDKGDSAYTTALELDSGIGTEQEWLDSLIGDHVKINGSYATLVDLETAAATVTVNMAYAVVDDNGLYYVKADRSLINLGTFKGDQGIQGEQGIQGLQGDPHLPFTIVGTVASVDALPVALEALPAEAYLVPVDEINHVYVFNSDTAEWIDIGPYQGPKGDKGEPGDKGDLGDTGPQGSPALPFNVVDKLATVGELPAVAESNPAEAYSVLVDEIYHLYVFIEASNVWTDLGPYQGPKGETGDRGPEGPQGEIGRPFSIVGTLESIGALPETGVAVSSEAYLVPVDGLNHIYVFNPVTDAWMDLGLYQGPQGEQGIEGPEGPKGETALPFTIVGTLNAVDQLPAVLEASSEEAYVVVVEGLKHIYVFNPVDGSWLDLGLYQGPKGDEGKQGIEGPKGATGEDGIDGESAYDLAVVGGYEGTDIEWIASLKGERGETGRNLKVKGTKPTLAEIQALVDPVEQDAWITADTLRLYMYIDTAWVDLGTHKGPKGDKGEKGDTGDAGKSAYELAFAADPSVGNRDAWLESLIGPKGETGDKGEVGEKFEISGIVDTYAELPPATVANKDKVWAVASDSYYINLSGSAWTLVGTIAQQGEKGVQGNSFRIIGELETQADLPLVSEVTDGEAYVVTTEAETKVIFVANQDTSTWDGPFDIQGPAGPVGPIGDDGPQGPVGQGIKIVGDFLNLPALKLEHPTSELGDAYTVGPVGDKLLYVWAADSETKVIGYLNLGAISVGIRGPEGPRGPQGVPGIRGTQGYRGEKGSRWVILPPENLQPENNIGVTDDWCIDRSGIVWYRDAVGWQQFVQLFDVPVSEVPSPDAGKKMLRHNGGWTELEEYELPEDVVKKGNFEVGKTYTLTETGWVEGVPALSTVVAGTVNNVLRDGEWAELDTYSLPAKTHTANFTIQPVDQQCHKVTISAARTITLADGPSGRQCVVTVVLTGGTKVPTFPGAKVHWNDGDELTLYDTLTTVVCFWTGDVWVLAKGMGY